VVRRSDDNGAQLVVHVLAVHEEVVELVAADDRAQARHGDSLAGEAEVVHPDNGLDRIHHLEVDDRVDLDGHVVLRYDCLWRDVDDLDAKRDLD